MDDDAKSDSSMAFLDGAPVETEKLPARRGRPSGYNDEIASQICDAVAKGKTMEEIEALPEFPGGATVFRWLNQHEDFRASYDAAMQWRIERDADKLMAIALDKTEDYKSEVGSGETAVPVRVLDKTAIERSKLACGELRWLMSRRMPKKYGEPQPVVIQPPPAPGQFQPGDDAKWIGQGSGTIDIDPMQAEVAAWLKASR